jgi:formamidopyrimidine-DNA glycosylase
LSLHRRAKYILVNLDDGHCLLVHLGMTGRFTVLDGSSQPHNLGEFYFEPGAIDAGSGPHDHVVITLDNGTRVVYTDHRRFGVMDLLRESELASHRLLKEIGVEPLVSFSADFLAHRFKKNQPPESRPVISGSSRALGTSMCESCIDALSPRHQTGTLVRKQP